MKKPTLEQMKAWRDKATERLSVLARNNAIEEPIEIGEECYQLGDDCCKPDGYGQFRWVTEDQFDSVLPPGIEHDRYVTMTNTVGFDDEIKEWADNWNDPEYWDDAADEALGEGQADGAYWTTRDEDPSDANSARALAASQIALELDGDWVGMSQDEADRLVWDNRKTILKNVGAYADVMPADLTNRVCIMGERAATPTPAPDPWIGVDMDALLENVGPALPDPEPGIDPASGTNPMGPGIGM